MYKSIMVLLLVSLVGCATRSDPRLSLPYSERVGIIHAYEAINFVPVDKGEKNHILFYKSAPEEILRRYRSFDTQAISQSHVVYGSINRQQAAARMREYIVAKLTQAGFRHTRHGSSQAGIAVAVSSYQKIPGKPVEELMLVVFDRKLAREKAQAGPDLKGYQLLKQTAVWVGVVRQVPSRDDRLAGGMHIMSRADFQKMVDLMFEGFMRDSHFQPIG